jgi:hypothetical protein
MSYGAILSLFMGHLYSMMFTTYIYNCTYIPKNLRSVRYSIIDSYSITYLLRSFSFCNTCHCYRKSIWPARFPMKAISKCTNLHCTVHTLLHIRSELCSIKSSNIILICVWKCGSNQVPNAN